MLKEFQDDEILCTRLVTHLSSESAKLFCTGDIKNSTLNIYSPYGLPLIWKKSSASKYPALSSFERGEQKGIHERGVYLLWFHEALTDHGYGCYVGSGRSAQGGMILRALQHGDPKHRAKNPTTHLYKHLGQPGTTHRVYRLARWPAIDEVPSKEETFDEILLVEMLWQIRLATGTPTKMSPFFKDVQDDFDGELPRTTIYKGLNVDSALEKPRKYSGGANRSFS